MLFRVHEDATYNTSTYAKKVHERVYHENNGTLSLFLRNIVQPLVIDKTKKLE